METDGISNVSWVISWVITLSFLAWLARYMVRSERRKKESQKEREAHALALLREAITEHISTLSRKRRQLVKHGDYGERDTSKWGKEIDRFLASLPEEHRLTITRDMMRRDIARTINQEVTSYQEGATSSGGALAPEIDFDPGMSGEDYERYCIALLSQTGWSAEETPTSGDQGADIVAVREGVRVVIQCKRYASNVGNAAVQQVFAAMAFYQADHAAVVTNADYTPSAIELAEGIGVLLLHHEDLRVLHERV